MTEKAMIEENKEKDNFPFHVPFHILFFLHFSLPLSLSLSPRRAPVSLPRAPVSLRLRHDEKRHLLFLR